MRYSGKKRYKKPLLRFARPTIRSDPSALHSIVLRPFEFYLPDRMINPRYQLQLFDGGEIGAEPRLKVKTNC